MNLSIIARREYITNGRLTNLFVSEIGRISETTGLTLQEASVIFFLGHPRKWDGTDTEWYPLGCDHEGVLWWEDSISHAAIGIAEQEVYAVSMNGNGVHYQSVNNEWCVVDRYKAGNDFPATRHWTASVRLDRLLRTFYPFWGSTITTDPWSVKDLVTDLTFNAGATDDIEKARLIWNHTIIDGIIPEEYPNCLIKQIVRSLIDWGRDVSDAYADYRRRRFTYIMQVRSWRTVPAR